MEGPENARNILQGGLLDLPVAYGAFGFALKIQEVKVIPVDQDLAQVVIPVDPKAFSFEFGPVEFDKALPDFILFAACSISC